MTYSGLWPPLGAPTLSWHWARTLSVAPAATIPIVGLEHGAAYSIVNQGPTDHDGLAEVTLRIEGDVGDVLPPAVEFVFP